MKKISKYKVDPFLLGTMIILAVISIITIFSAQSLLPSYSQDLALKQTIWYVVGFAIAYFIMFIGNQYIYHHIWILYGFGVASLAALLIFATPINQVKAWFSIPGVGTIQPSEFMKIILIMTLGKIINDFYEEYSNPTVREEAFLLLKVGLVLFLPSVLTFLQPDTGVVLIYLLITGVMLFVAGLRFRWYAIASGIIAFFVAIILGLYFINTDLLVDLVGTNFFLRIDRLLDWSNQSGFQLQNGISAIGSGGLWGNGFNNTPIYFPEPQTDFIFAVFASNFGLIGTIILLSLITFLDIRLIQTATKAYSNVNKYVIAGILGMLIYQQVQNIGMTLGLMPITGITLPFISYGGSSLLSYMIMAGIFFNVSNESIRYTN